jgi:formate hydrogenlyase subunit 3/multisubunit Na+/H+ antiporter MnhD subunit
MLLAWFLLWIAAAPLAAASGAAALICTFVRRTRKVARWLAPLSMACGTLLTALFYVAYQRAVEHPGSPLDLFPPAAIQRDARFNGAFAALGAILGALASVLVVRGRPTITRG